MLVKKVVTPIPLHGTAAPSLGTNLGFNSAEDTIANAKRENISLGNESLLLSLDRGSSVTYDDGNGSTGTGTSLGFVILGPKDRRTIYIGIQGTQKQHLEIPIASSIEGREIKNQQNNNSWSITDTENGVAKTYILSN